MDESDDPVSVWTRWSEPDDVPFHRFCSLVPRRSGRDAADGPGFRFVRGPIRTGLKYAPLVVLAVGLGFAVVGERTDDVVGLSAHLPTVSLAVDPLYVIAGVVWVGLLALPLRRIDVVPTRRIAAAVGLYGLLGVLAVGTVLAVVLTARPESIPLIEPANAGPRRVIDSSGLLLLMLVGGALTYDLVVRLETVMCRLPTKRPAVVREPETEGPTAVTYADFLESFRGALDARMTLPGIRGVRPTVRVAYVFATLFLSPFVLSRLLQYNADTGGLLGNLEAMRVVDVAAALAPTVLNVFLVVVFFQFLVFVAYFNRLLTEHGPRRGDRPDRFTLMYTPEHPDGYAGFKDFGRIATRVNTLLVLAGFYLAYRLYVLGLPALEAMDPAAGTAAFLNWGLLFLGPLAVYTLGALAWLYLSFWQLHRAMTHGRQAKLREAASSDTGIDVRDVRSAPLWPVNSGLLLSIISVDAMPLLTLLPLL
jgi:hypothetical protein